VHLVLNIRINGTSVSHDKFNKSPKYRNHAIPSEDALFLLLTPGNTEKNKIVYNEKQGGSATWLLLVMSMGHWRSRFVCLKFLSSSFLKHISVSSKYRQIIRRYTRCVRKQMRRAS
jgi:hypothetical protein